MTLRIFLPKKAPRPLYLNELYQRKAKPYKTKPTRRGKERQVEKILLRQERE
jgi:phage FluMu protein Com